MPPCCGRRFRAPRLCSKRRVLFRESAELATRITRAERLPARQSHWLPYAKMPQHAGIAAGFYLRRNRLTIVDCFAATAIRAGITNSFGLTNDAISCRARAGRARCVAACRPFFLRSLCISARRRKKSYSWQNGLFVHLCHDRHDPPDSRDGTHATAVEASRDETRPGPMCEVHPSRRAARTSEATHPHDQPP